ncbi:MAG: hypothetical protein EA382_19140, partial [Spirochaetaceae bacterium]
DDINTTNNTAVSPAYFVNNPAILDYVATDVSRQFTVVTTGSPVSETFTLANIGGLAGTDVVTWRAIASPTQNPVDGTEIGTGTLAALGANGVLPLIPITGLWPAVPGDYYLIIEVSATDELPEHKPDYGITTGTIRVNAPPDYEFASVSLPIAAYGGHPGELWTTASSSHGGPPDHAFEIREIAGNPGQQGIQWRVHRSTNTTLNAGDPIVAQGLTAPLGANASTGTITLDPLLELPATPGRYYYILNLIAGDDANPANNTYVVGPVDVWLFNDPIVVPTDINASSTFDYFVRPNRGEVVRFQGLIHNDRYPPLEDYHFITPGVDVTELRMRVIWTGNADLDILVYTVVPFGIIAESIDLQTGGGAKSEPNSGTFNVVVTPGRQYLIAVQTFRSSAAGTIYTLEITAHPPP